MSDKTKRLRDDAEQRRRFNEIAAKPVLPPVKCPCGHSHLDRKLVAANNPGGGVSIWCVDCAPGDVREIGWPSGE